MRNQAGRVGSREMYKLNFLRHGNFYRCFQVGSGSPCYVQSHLRSQWSQTEKFCSRDTGPGGHQLGHQPATPTPKASAMDEATRRASSNTVSFKKEKRGRRGEKRSTSPPKSLKLYTLQSIKLYTLQTTSSKINSE